MKPAIEGMGHRVQSSVISQQEEVVVGSQALGWDMDTGKGGGRTCPKSQAATE